MSQTATYKGRTYRLKFIGQTKFGRRAHLEFQDGSKSFWVDASQVSVTGNAPATGGRVSRRRGRVKTCPSCGGNEINQVECGDCA